MHGTVPIAEHATSLPDQAARQTVSEDENDWFTGICETLLPKDAGLALHITTGFEERTCYRYAVGDRKTPGWFIVRLLRSEQGRQWLTAFMGDEKPNWWADLQGAIELSATYSILRK